MKKSSPPPRLTLPGDYALVGDGVDERVGDRDRLAIAADDAAFVVDRGRGRGIAVIAVIDRDRALHALNHARGVIVDGAAADRNGLRQVAGGSPERLDGAVIVETQQIVDVDAVTVLRATGSARNRAMVDDVGGAADGIQVDAGAELAGDRAVIVDGDGELASDAVARADDRAIGEIVDRGAAGRQFGRGRGLEIDGIIAAGGRTRVLADDLAMIVDGGIVTGPNRVIVRGADDKDRR